MNTVREDVLCELEVSLSKTTDDAGKLDSLASHESVHIRKNVASNKYASPAVLAVLARDRDADVRMSAAEALVDRGLKEALIFLAQDKEADDDVLLMLRNTQVAGVSDLATDTLVERYLTHFSDFLLAYSAITAGNTIEECRSTGVL